MEAVENKEEVSVARRKELLQQVKSLHQELLSKLDYLEIDKLQSDPIELRLYLLKQIEKLIEEKNITPSDNENMDLVVSFMDEVLGFGPVETLLRDETITDIFINGPETIYVERRGRVVRSSICFLSEDHILRLVQRVASKAGRHLDLGSPYFDAQLPDGSRIHAIIKPIAIDGIKVSIRKYLFQKLTIQTLVDGDSLTPEMSKFLQIAVKARFNIAVCGGTGSGKTTLLNAMMGSIRQGERIITIEDTPELEPVHHHTVRLLTRGANPEGKGAVTQADLMINALRMRPDRVVLGELRGAEAFNLLHAMNTGQDGSMVTLHASGAEEVISRLLNMILMARYTLSPESVLQQIAGAIDIIVYVSRLVSGARRVMTISQLSNDTNGNILIDDLFRFNIDHISAEELQGSHGKIVVAPTQRNENKLITAGLMDEYREIFPYERAKSNLQEDLAEKIEEKS